MVFWYSQAEYQGIQTTPYPTITEYYADLGGCGMTAEYHIIFAINIDHLHRNCGTRIDGGRDDNEVWQHHCKCIRNTPMRWYGALLGRLSATL